jgi:hypothetical protein
VTRLAGDQTHSTIMHCFLEKQPNGRDQGACFPFRQGFGSGVVPVRQGKDAKSVRLYVKGLEEGHIHDLTASGVKSADGESLLHPQAYYTLSYLQQK